jgi:hypothetical protein
MGVQTKAEYGHRKSLFGETHDRIAKHNSNAAASFKMEHNEFSTMVIIFFFSLSFSWLSPAVNSKISISLQLL